MEKRLFQPQYWTEKSDPEVPLPEAATGNQYKKKAPVEVRADPQHVAPHAAGLYVQGFAPAAARGLRSHQYRDGPILVGTSLSTLSLKSIPRRAGEIFFSARASVPQNQFRREKRTRVVGEAS